MSDHGPAGPVNPEYLDKARLGGWPGLLAAAFGVGAAGTAVLAWINPVQFGFSWLFAFWYFFTLCCGCLFWVLVHHATDAEWSVVVRRQLENVAVLIGALAVFFVPVLLMAPKIYRWWTLPPGADPVLDLKSGYLNVPFFLVRCAAYFALLSLVAFGLRRRSSRQDDDGHPGHTIAMRKLAFFGIPVLALSLTFAAFDWLMALDFLWFSTMWGVYLFAGAAGASMSLAVLIVSALRARGYLANAVTAEHYHIMGKLMLAFTIFWAYIGFSQYMLIWYANIPEETSFYIRRNIQSWHLLSTLLVIGRFFLPFPLLLLQATKRNPRVLCAVAAWILAMQFVDLYIIVMPMLHKTGFAPHPLDFLAPATIGSALAFLFLRLLTSGPLFPPRDPRVRQSIALTN